MGLKDLIQESDFKKEKHVPVIEVIEKNENKFKLHVSVGKEIPHPNTTEHHICWIEVYFKPDDGKFPYLLGRFTFDAHGASVNGPNTSGVFAEPDVTFVVKIEVPGELFALSYCNIHGLWESEAVKI